MPQLPDREKYFLVFLALTVGASILVRMTFA